MIFQFDSKINVHLWLCSKTLLQNTNQNIFPGQAPEENAGRLSIAQISQASATSLKDAGSLGSHELPSTEQPSKPGTTQH